MSELNNKDTIIRKIKRCMELTESSNPNEAAIALKQMRKLMDTHQIDHSTLLASDVIETQFELDVSQRPAAWVLYLHEIVAKAMDCENLILIRKKNRFASKNVRVVFLGVAPNPEIASYTFEVLYKALKKSRKKFAQDNLDKADRSLKTKLCDAYCEGWAHSVYEKVKNLNPSKNTKEKINAYKKANESKFGKVKKFENNSRVDESELNISAMQLGYLDGKEVQLHVATEHKDHKQID